METYTKQLASPKWQKRRLEILQRDEWKCQKCGDGKIELHIHHKQYIKGKKVHEYEDWDLVTLCAHCHHEIELIKKVFPEQDFDSIKIFKTRLGENGATLFISIKNIFGIRMIVDGEYYPISTFDKALSIEILDSLNRHINNNT